MTATGTSTRTPTRTSTRTFTATRTPTFGILGTRHFTFDPASSSFSFVLPGFESRSTGFQGFIDLTAGRPDPSSGLAFVDVTAASEFLSIDLNPAAPLTVCLRPLEMPVVRAGVLSCTGTAALGERISVDHRAGEIVEGGFRAEDCTALGGTVESETDPHPRVCNGPLEFASHGPASGAGALKLGLDPALGLVGLPVELTVEAALPCGDEGEGVSTNFGLVTGVSRAEIFDANNEPGRTLAHEVHGENFSCHAWTQENGPGRLTIALPALHAFSGTDLINVFEWDD